MFKRICIAMFAISLIAPTAVEAKSKQTYPAWVDKAWANGHRCKRWEKLIREHHLPVKAFSYICWRESRANAKAWNRNDPHTGSYGLFQINGSWTSLTAQVCKSEWGDLKALWNPVCNVKVAVKLFAEDGFGPWGW